VSSIEGSPRIFVSMKKARERYAALAGGSASTE
jgi:hypothetical protein